MTRLVHAAAVLTAFACCSPELNAQLILNGDFEATATLGPGQTPVAPNSGKLLISDPAHPNFSTAILAVPNWTNSFVDVGFGPDVRDAGLSRVDFAGSGETQYAYINNWETRLSQVTAHTVAAGETYSASIDVGFIGDSEAGRFQLWAGEPLPANPDVFPPTAVLLAEVSVASPGWSHYTPDLLLSTNAWHPLHLAYTAPSSGSMLGQKLTLSMITSNASVGPTFWDDAELSVVPEPKMASLASWGFSVVAVILPRRRGRI